MSASTVHQPDHATTVLQSKATTTKKGRRPSPLRHRWLPYLLLLPGMAWLVVLFLLPFYVVLAIAFGAVDPLFRTPVPAWNPVEWNPFQFQLLIDRIFGSNGFLGPAFVRTFVYVIAASALCLLLATRSPTT